MTEQEYEDCLLHRCHHEMGPVCWAFVSEFYAGLKSVMDPLEAYRQAYEWGCILDLQELPD